MGGDLVECHPIGDFQEGSHAVHGPRSPISALLPRRARASKAQTPQKSECGREIVLFLNGQRTCLFPVVTREELEVAKVSADIALLAERRIVCTCGDSFKDWGDFEEHQDKANLHLACGRERHSPEEW